LTFLVGWVQGGSPWPVAAIQDSIAAVVRQRAYERSVRATLFDRILEWISALVRRFFASIDAVPNAKWMILALGVVALLAIAARVWLGFEAEERRRRVRAGVVGGASDPWVDAERLAAAGNFTQAAHLLYRGLTERLAATEEIRLHPSKTSGDYARELAMRGSRSHGEFRQFGRRYDRVLFGTGSCDAATYAVLRDHASRVIGPEARAA
jgi:hypothetical protein